jgi:parallel beta-helix repeat protein
MGMPVKGTQSKRALFSLALILSFLFTSGASANFAPPPPGTRYGFVHIMADGSLSPDDLPIMRSGDGYTLLGNLTNFGFKIERDGVVLDGAGFSIQATDWFAPRTGVVLEGRSGVTIRNLKIVNFDTGILINGSLNSIVEGARILNSVNGISLISGSSNNTLIGNFLQGNIYHGYGIFIAGSPGNTLRNNTVSSGERTFYWASTNKLNFCIEVNRNTPLADLVQDIDTSNLLDDKPLYYWVAQQDKAVPADAGYVALVNVCLPPSRGRHRHNRHHSNGIQAIRQNDPKRSNKTRRQS